MTPQALQQQVLEAFNRHAQAGVEAFKAHAGEAARLSHICLKFNSLDAYRDTVASARALGTVTQEEFNGKQISWCRLQKPLEKDGLKLEFLELVEPRTEQNAFSGVTSVGYSSASLKTVVKLPSDDNAVIFRYQSQHAETMAPKA